ncbi:hypothetical protein Tco_1097445 [Tanacetum coccineum]
MNMRKGRTQPYEANVMLLIEIVFPVMLNASSNCCFDPLQRLPVVGILTRHDFMPEHILGLHPMLERSKWKRLRFKFPLWNKIF